MNCISCDSSGGFEDGFCSACGVEQPLSNLPVKRQAVSLPAIWRDAAPVVARGAALVAAGIAAEFLLRSMARGAIPTSARRKQTNAPVVSRATFFEEIVTVSQTVVTRRVITRR